jgi:ornithine--oxo-acid transaminase
MTTFTTENIISETETCSAHNYHPLPVVLVKGEGIWVWDIDGKKYLDMLSAYSALNQGHRHPRIVGALIEQSEKITLTSRAFHNELMGKFLKKLCTICQMEIALPMNTGAEAVETAIKAARKWGYAKKKVARDRAHIIVCENNFHGRTTTIVGFSTEHQYRDGFGPFTPGFSIIPYGDIAALESALTPDTVAFMVEPIQGEAGINIPPQGYIKKAYDLCKKHTVLFIADEIQTGFGRTGRLLCCDHDGVKPDMLIVGKALGGGIYPVSATLSSKEVMDVFKPGDHGSTFGGNPLASAVAIASLDVIVEEKLAERSAELGTLFTERLRSIKSRHIKEVRGKGLMIGLEIVKESGPARPFCEKLQHLGILAKETHGQVIRLAPPLIISREDLDWAADIIEKVLTE